MNGARPLGQRLDARIRHALEPARFPERRDLELAFAVRQAGEGTAFFDHFWLDATTLWAVGAQIDRGGLAGGIAATGLRQLLRALVAELNDPAAVIAEAQSRWDGALPALALMRLDAASGALRHAAEGRASCSPAVERLAPGQVQWLVVGMTTTPDDAEPPTRGLQALVDRYSRPPLAVAAALQFKAAAKTARTTTLVVRNDRADVPDALVALRAFLGRHAVGDEDASVVELALDEILTNQINYGYRDGGVHEILVEARVEDSRLAVEIRDDGVPFDPLGVAAPDLDAGIDERQLGGLGMHFVRSVVDEVSYRRSGGWNVLMLGKRLGRAEEGEQPA